MPLFWKPYKSEVTSFIEELKAKKPTLEAEQRAGRALLWDGGQAAPVQGVGGSGGASQKLGPFVVYASFELSLLKSEENGILHKHTPNSAAYIL